MRRGLAVAALGMALLTVPAWGQRRGGASIGGHAGFASHPAMGGFHGSAGGFRGGFHSPSMRRPAFSGSHWAGGHWGPGFHHRPFHNSCWNCFHHRNRFNAGYPWGYGYPYGYAGWGYPWYDDDYATNDYQPEPGNYYSLESSQAQSEIDRLSDQVARLSDQLQSGARGVPRPPEQKQADPEPTQLVFADKHTERIHNYAVVRQTLWVFDDSRTRRIPLASLDIRATQKANEEQGVDFQIPN